MGMPGTSLRAPASWPTCWLAKRCRPRSLIGDAKRAQARILKCCEDIDRLESDADRVLRTALSKLFREERDVKTVMKLRGLYELLEGITDRCEDVANVLEGIVLENA